MAKRRTRDSRSESPSLGAARTRLDARSLWRVLSARFTPGLAFRGRLWTKTDFGQKRKLRARWSGRLQSRRRPSKAGRTRLWAACYGGPRLSRPDLAPGEPDSSLTRRKRRPPPGCAAMPRPTLPQIVARPGDACPRCTGRLAVYSTRREKAVAVQYLRCRDCQARFRSLRHPAALRPASKHSVPSPARKLLNALRRGCYHADLVQPRMRILDCYDLALVLGQFLVDCPSARSPEAPVRMLTAFRHDPTLRGWLWAKALLPPGSLVLESTPDDEVSCALAQRKIGWPELWSHLPEMVDLLQFAMRRLAAQPHTA